MKKATEITTSRRQFMAATGGLFLTGNTVADQPASLAGVIGITTGSLNYQRENRILDALTLPKFVRDHLGMELIDLNTRWLEHFDEGYLDRVRESAGNHGCYISNLKVNHTFGDLYDPDPAEKKRAMVRARELVEAAKILGARWIRFSFPKFPAGGDPRSLQAHRELAEFAEDHGVQLLVENNGWMKSDADSVRRVVKAIGRNVAPGPDTGNWEDDVRYEGIGKSFPGAVTCDFKVFELDSDGHHAPYDVKRCFDIAWKAGFRGPWAIEHWHEDNAEFARETVFLKEQLEKWMKESR